MGRFGQKTGAGYYRYEPGDRTPHPRPAGRRDHRTRRARGRDRRAAPSATTRSSSAASIRWSTRRPKILDEGIATRPGDIDVVWIYGYGFPVFRGGPLRWADSVGLATIVDDMREFERRCTARAGTPAPLLVELARIAAARSAALEGNGRPRMREAVIVSTARTPIGKAFRGAFNDTHGATLASHVIRHAVERSGLEPGEIEDVILGCADPEGATGSNIARIAAYRAGLPVTTGGTTINRFCSSGLQAIALAAQRVIVDGVPAIVAGGVESISLVQTFMNKHRTRDEWTIDNKPELYMPMIDTAEVVAERYGVSRETQDEYALLSQQRIAAAQRRGPVRRRDRPAAARKAIADKDDRRASRTKTSRSPRTRATARRRPLEDLAKLKPVRGQGKTITAGNASQLSDGASACVVMDAKLAEQRDITPLGYYRGMVPSAASPTRWGSARSSRSRSCSSATA